MRKKANRKMQLFEAANRISVVDPGLLGIMLGSDTSQPPGHSCRLLSLDAVCSGVKARGLTRGSWFDFPLSLMSCDSF